MNDLLISLATSAPGGPVDPAQQQAVGRAFLLIVVLIIIGILVVIGLLMAGFAWFAKNNTDLPERKDRFAGVDAWAESARRADPEHGADAPDEDDWEADEEDGDGD